MLIAVVTLSVAVTLLSILVLGLLRSHALILRALDELGAGLDLERAAAEPSGSGDADSQAAGTGSNRAVGPSPVPVELGDGVVGDRPAGARRTATDIVGTDLDGREQRLRIADGSTLLAFLSSGCSVCHEFWQAFARPHELDIPAGARLVVVVQGPANESAGALRRLAAPGLSVVQSDAAWTDYDIPGSPYFVHIEGGVVTGEGSSTSWAQVRSLMDQGVADIAQARADRAAHDPQLGRGSRDDLPRMDRELMAAGIHPGHPSLYASPDTTQDGSHGGRDTPQHPHPLGVDG